MKVSSKRDGVIYNRIWKEEAGVSKASDTAHQLVSLLKRGASICDLGAGGGRHSRLFASHGMDVLALDRNQESLRALKKISEEFSNCTVVCNDILSFLNTCKMLFDAVVLWDCAHHVVFSVVEFKDLVDNLRAISKDEGYLLLTMLVDIEYPDDLGADDRYMLNQVDAVKLLDRTFNSGWELVKQKDKTFCIPTAEGLQGDSIIVGNYRATRLVRLYKKVKCS